MNAFFLKKHGILSKQFLKSGGICEECIPIFLGISNPVSVYMCMCAHMQKDFGFQNDLKNCDCAYNITALQIMVNPARIFARFLKS